MRTIDTVKEIETICNQVLRKVTPKRTEREATIRFSQQIVEKVAHELNRVNLQADVQIQGSIAKDTWLAGEKDIDVFVSLEKQHGKEIFFKVLKVIKSIAGEQWKEAYAEHPYIKAIINNYKIDFVPCFKIEEGEETGSSVDRTPLHTAYVRTHLSQEAHSEVRLLKQFLRGIGVYGAEIKVQGFSGYLCELLILYYQSFRHTLQAMTSWQCGQLIQIENHERKDNIKCLFNTPLIVIDPIDPQRNVAAAVSVEKFGETILAARYFLATPERSFFFPREDKTLSKNALTHAIERLNFDVIFVLFKGTETIPDILWGQLYKTTQALRRALTENTFSVLRESTWSDEKELNIIIFGLETASIPLIKKHLGPPIDSKEATSFIEKYSRNTVVVAGPIIEENRWVVYLKRHHTDAVMFLNAFLKEEVENLGVASGLVQSIREATIVKNTEILDFTTSNQEFTTFFSEFLRGKPKWMK